MKKIFALSLAAVMSLSLLVGCGGGDTGDAGDAGNNGDAGGVAYDKINIIAAHGAADDTALHLSFTKFGELLDERSGGTVKLDLYPNQQLGGDREYTEAAIQGDVHMGAPSTANIASFDPALNAFETPFLFPDRETAYATLDSDAGIALLNSLEEAGLKGLGYFENGFRHLTCNTPVESLSDLSGLKIRVMENEVHLAIWDALGTNPGPLAFGELYTALQQGAFGAQENPAELINSTKFYEVQDYLVKTNHIYTPYMVYMNLDMWNGLNAETQALIEECMADAVEYCRGICAENEAAAFQAIEDSGKCTIIEVSDEMRAEMVEACAGVYDLVRELSGGTYAEDFWAAAGLET